MLRLVSARLRNARNVSGLLLPAGPGNVRAARRQPANAGRAPLPFRGRHQLLHAVASGGQDHPTAGESAVGDMLRCTCVLMAPRSSCSLSPGRMVAWLWHWSAI